MFRAAKNKICFSPLRDNLNTDPVPKLGCALAVLLIPLFTWPERVFSFLISILTLRRKQQNMMKSLGLFSFFVSAVLAVTTCIGVLFFCPSSAQANLSISPPRIVFEQSQRSVDVVLANTSNETKTYEVSLVNKAMDQSGQLSPAFSPATNEFFADTVLRYAPHTVTIKPGGVQKVRLISGLREDNPDGEYRSHLLFEDVTALKAGEPEGIVLGISIPVILRKGNLSASVTLSDPKLIRTKEETFVELDLNRTGNRSIVGKLEIFQGGGSIGSLNNVAVYLSTPKRKARIKIEPKDYASEMQIHYSDKNGKRLGSVDFKP